MAQACCSASIDLCEVSEKIGRQRVVPTNERLYRGVKRVVGDAFEPETVQVVRLPSGRA